MAEALALNIIRVVLVKLGSSSWEELVLVKSFSSDLSDMRRKLSSIQVVLQESEGRSSRDKTVTDWLKKLRDAAHDIDDLVDEIQVEVKRREATKRSAVHRFFSSSNPIAFRIVMAHRMRSLRERLDAVSAERAQFRLYPDCRPNNRWQQMEHEKRETFSLIDASRIVGRADDKERIMKLVLDAASEEDVSIIPIVGMGGLGKTTLAQLVFNDPRANEEIFDPRIWVSASVNFNLRTIVEPILAASKEKCDLNSLEAIANFLMKTFTGMKYLLVLDDVWHDKQEEWERLKLLLRGGKRGSKIIVTTRSRRVAMMVRTMPPFNLRGLSEQDCWELFKRKAFEQGEEQMHPNLVRIGKEIVKKCGGVPLAANALGSMLRFKRSDNSWRAVRDSEVWQLEQEDTILPSLKLSYSQMPCQLKQCFAYCSIFPKHYEINKEKLIQQWIALGFIESTSQLFQSLEDKGNDYFDHLLWMSFIQELESHGSVMYRIHHLVHDLAQLVSGDEVQVIKSEEAMSDLEACRYASLMENTEMPELPKTTLRKVKALHSKHFLHAVRLRVLNLHGSQIKELPRSIKKLKHLRYLDISSSCIKTLHESIGSIPSLQTLHLSHCHDLHMLPNSISKLHNLHVLDLSACKIHALPASIGDLQNLESLNLSLCYNIEELPESVGKLEKLRLINLEGCMTLTKLPESICSLSNLLSANLSRCGLLRTLPQSFGGLSSLQHINLSQCNHLEALPESIGRISRLQTLNLAHCSHISTLPETTGYLEDLQILNLSHYSTTRILPVSIGNLASLHTLNLSWNVGLEALPDCIGNLQSLRSLILFQCCSLRTLPRNMINLTKLETLNIVGCQELSELPEGINRMTNLRHLMNDKCQSLKGLPLGLEKLTKLESLPLVVVGGQQTSRYSTSAELEHLDLLSGKLSIEWRMHARNLTSDAKGSKLKEKQNLRSLSLSWASSLPQEEVERMLDNLLPPQNLEVLIMDGYTGTKFSGWMMNGIESWLPNLVSIQLSTIPHCHCLPSLGQLPSLKSIELRHMTGLHSIGTEFIFSEHCRAPYPSLRELHFEDVPNLEKWTITSTLDDKEGKREVFMFPCLKIVIATGCPKLRPDPCLPGALLELMVCDSSEMLSFEGTIVGPLYPASPSLLRRLWIRNGRVSAGMWKGLKYQRNLEELTVENCEDLSELPESMQYLTALRELKIAGCSNLETLPEWLGELCTLESLEIFCCPKVISLPQGLQSLTMLEELTLSGCSPALKEGCQKERGKEWSKICHIPNVYIS